MLRYLCVVVIGLCATITVAGVHDPRALNADPFSSTEAIAPRLTGLGDAHFKVTTSNPESQYFFDQGMRLNAGFNHSEALRAFKEAVRLDHENAMAYWGWALVLGPNLNLPMQEAVMEQAYAAIQGALALKRTVSEREADYIDALAARYSADPQADRAALDAAYVEALRQLVEKYPDDLDAATFYAAAIMNTNPWDYWYKDGTPKPQTKIVLSTLESVLKQNPNHPAANHYYIHTVEAFRPELGEAAADRLRPLMPGSGHLVHMPSHIYMRLGRYKESWDINVKAARADEKYVSQCNAQGMVPIAYYPHNMHFQVWSAMFLGNSANALASARKIHQKMPPSIRDNPWGVNESFRSQPVFALTRFGLWEAMLAEPMPAGKAPYMMGIWRYGRGLAFLHTGDTKAAYGELARLISQQAAVQAEPGYAIGFGAASTLLAVAVNVLQGELAASKGDYRLAVGHLDKAVRLEDTLLYNEPPDWYFPVRHVLGAVLLEAGNAAEAEVVYWEDLRRNPDNGYALFGLSQALAAQGDVATKKEIDRRFALAWQYADVKLTSSRY
jgi:tetratricopeptide (TPR) repeat protein